MIGGICLMKLRPYQAEDVKAILKHDSLGIFNEQRTGKTPTSLVAMSTKTQGRILIIATASMVYKWQDEAKTWTDRQAYVYEGTPKQRELALESFRDNDSSILVISYGLVKSTKSYTGLMNTLKRINISGLIVDEVHRAVGRKTANFRAIRGLVKIPYRYYLTGTPAPNHPSQVWSILTIINPKDFSSYWSFTEEFFILEDVRLPYHVQVSKIQKPTDFLPNMEDKYVEILNEHAIMRKRKDVMPWLPKEEEPTKIKLPLTLAQQRYIKEMTEYYETEHIIVQGVLDQLLRLRQICLAPELLDLKGKSPKLQWLADYISDYPEKSIIVFSKFTQFIHLLKKKIPQFEVLMGDVTTAKRNALIKDFQSDTIKLLAIQIDTGKEGITLDSADTLIFTDMFPPASDILQAKDRIVATSEERNKPKEVIELMMADSYDEELYKLTHAKVESTDIANNYIQYLKGVVK